MSALDFEDLPALYRSADALSAESQSTYLRLVFAEYSLLVCCACMTISPIHKGWYFLIYTTLFCLALASFIYRYVNKPDQVWYQARALAESIKTLSWKYAMRAEPFDSSDHIAYSDFTNRMHDVLKANEFAGRHFPPDWGAEPQVTSKMNEIRKSPLLVRCNTYQDDRIQNQRNWYAAKSGYNKRRAKYWSIACAVTYAAAILSSAVRIDQPHWTLLPTEPLIAIAAGLVGWIQIKKFNELASSYILTAHEIGILHQKVDSSSEKNFSDFVNDAEQAFSREHTQWVARFGD